MSEEPHFWHACGVRRWHTHPYLSEAPADRIDGHSARVALMLTHLIEVSPQLLIAALMHDLDEALVGDLPAAAKQAAPQKYRAFAEAASTGRAGPLADTLGAYRRMLGSLEPYEMDLLNACDKLDAALWGRKHMPEREDFATAMIDQIYHIARILVGRGMAMGEALDHTYRLIPKDLRLA